MAKSDNIEKHIVVAEETILACVSIFIKFKVTDVNSVILILHLISY